MNAKTTRTAAPAGPKLFKKKTVLTPKPVNADIRNMPPSVRKRYLSDVAADFKRHGFSVTCAFYEHAERCSKTEATFQVNVGNADTGLRIATVALTQLLRDGVLVKTKNGTHEVFMHKALVPKASKVKPASKPKTSAKAKQAKPEQTPRIPYDNSQLSRLPVPVQSRIGRVTLRGMSGTVRCTEHEWTKLTAHRKNRRVIGNAIQVSPPRIVTVKQLLEAAGLKPANNSTLKTKIQVTNSNSRWATVEETEAWVAGELELRRTLALRMLDRANDAVGDAEEELKDAIASIKNHEADVEAAKKRQAEINAKFGYLKLI